MEFSYIPCFFLQKQKEENQMPVDPHRGSIAQMDQTGEATTKRWSCLLQKYVSVLESDHC